MICPNDLAQACTKPQSSRLERASSADSGRSDWATRAPFEKPVVKHNITKYLAMGHTLAASHPSQRLDNGNGKVLPTGRQATHSYIMRCAVTWSRFVPIVAQLHVNNTVTARNAVEAASYAAEENSEALKCRQRCEMKGSYCSMRRAFCSLQQSHDAPHNSAKSCHKKLITRIARLRRPQTSCRKWPATLMGMVQVRQGQETALESWPCTPKELLQSSWSVQGHPNPSHHLHFQRVISLLAPRRSKIAHHV